MNGVVEASTPYPWPYDGRLARDRAALVVLGWNDEWWDRYEVPDHVTASVSALADAVGHVVVVHQPIRSVGSGPEGPSPAPASRSGSTAPPLANAKVVTAVGLDGFFGGPLDQVLRSSRCDLLLVVGLGLETAVHSTMRSANDRGYECLLVVDACVAADSEFIPACISMVEMSGGIFGAVADTVRVLDAFAATADATGEPIVQLPPDHVTSTRGTP